MDALKLESKVLKKKSVSDIIYAEIAEGGAMGSDGQVMLYVIKNKQLVCYTTNLFADEKNIHKQKKNY